MVQYEQRSLHADRFNREYTKEEENRKEALRKEYENGRFPEGTLTLVKSAGQAVDSDQLVYARDTSCFYLPERALTDEELLQILDFNSKRDFALEQNLNVQQQRQEAWEEANDSDTLR